MKGTGILDNVIQYIETDKKSATHFVLCNGSEARYFVNLSGGKKRLFANLSSYSKRLSFLMGVLDYIPFKFMEMVNLGYFVEAGFCDEVLAFMKKTSKEGSQWNVIVGTYDNKQKIVVQLWERNELPAIYYKIGNQASSKEMMSEIDFLKSAPKYKGFNIPDFISAQIMDENHRYNIQITKEFIGQKVEPILTDDIYKIFKELVESRGKEIVNGTPYGFSHGDFTPWNIKKNKDGYILFDWEHCGMRFYGFDLIHYVFQIENLINRRTKEESIKIAIEKTRGFDKRIYFKGIEELYFRECERTY